MDTEAIKNKIIGVMEKHRGRDNAVSNGFLAASVDSTSDIARQLVGDIVREGKANIGSHPEVGFYLIEDQEDLDLSNRQLRGRIAKVSERIKAAEQMFLEQHGPDFEQGKLALEDARKAMKGGVLK